MEACRPLKEQELFYASIEGKHAAQDDDIYQHHNAYVGIGVLFYRYNKMAQINFIKGYNNASREIDSRNSANDSGDSIER